MGKGGDHTFYDACEWSQQCCSRPAQAPGDRSSCCGVTATPPNASARASPATSSSCKKGRKQGGNHVRLGGFQEQPARGRYYKRHVSVYTPRRRKRLCSRVRLHGRCVSPLHSWWTWPALAGLQGRQWWGERDAQMLRSTCVTQPCRHTVVEAMRCAAWWGRRASATGAATIPTHPSHRRAAPRGAPRRGSPGPGRSPHVRARLSLRRSIPACRWWLLLAAVTRRLQALHHCSVLPSPRPQRTPRKKPPPQPAPPPFALTPPLHLSLPALPPSCCRQAHARHGRLAGPRGAPLCRCSRAPARRRQLSPATAPVRAAEPPGARRPRTAQPPAEWRGTAPQQSL